MSDQDDTRAQTIRGLRELADFLERTPDAEVDAAADVTILDYATTCDEFLAKAEKIGGPWEQVMDGGYFKLVRRFGPVKYQLYTNEVHVGEARQVVRPVTEWTPDPEVPARLDALNTVEDVAA
jgi:hypothetical protein